jgi:SAM-dependent methyltransferase
MNDHTREFYELEAQRYPRIHARPVQRYSASFERELMEQYVGPLSVCLDIGCGEGRTARALVDAGPGRTVIGLDFSLEMLRVAQTMPHAHPVHYCVGDAMNLPFAASTLDATVAVTSLNNVPDLRISLGEMARVLKPGGTMVLLVINKFEIAALFRGLYFFPFYVLRWLRGGKIYRSLVFSREELLKAMPEGVVQVKVQGMRLLPDLVPEWPLNFYAPFAPTFTRLLRWLAPADRWLCRHPFFGCYARFHFVVARKLSVDS